MEHKKAPSALSSVLDNENVRRLRRDDAWFYSVLDVVALLGETDHPEEYWSDLQRAEPQLSRLPDFLEFQLPDGPTQLLEMVPLQGLLRLAQSIPTPRAERVRAFLAESGRQRLEEAENPELAMLRVRRDYEQRGYDRRWVDKRLRGISARHELTSEWARRGATDSDQYRALTNRLMESAFGMDVESYRRSKRLTGTAANLRDHMTDMELVLTMLGEAAATALHRRHGSHSFDQLLDDVQQAGEVAATTRAAFAARAARRTPKKHNAA